METKLTLKLDIKYPSLIKKLSGIISEEDLINLSMQDEKSAYILRKYNILPQKRIIF